MVLILGKFLKGKVLNFRNLYSKGMLYVFIKNNLKVQEIEYLVYMLIKV